MSGNSQDLDPVHFLIKLVNNLMAIECKLVRLLFSYFVFDFKILFVLLSQQVISLEEDLQQAVSHL